MSALNKDVAGAKFVNNEMVQEAFNEGKSVVYNPAAIDSSTDPFTGKTNKYAESPIVRITALTKAVHYVWSSAGTAATTDKDVIPANTSRLFVVDDAKNYLRIIENAATADAFVTEIY